MTKILIDEAVVRQALEDFVDIKYGLEKSRIWGGVDWTYNPMPPVHYLPLRDKADVQISVLHQALANAALDKMADNARELGLDYMEGSAEQYEKELEQPAPAQEPVAWWDPKLGVFDEKHFDQLQPLYLHQTPAQPDHIRDATKKVEQPRSEAALAPANPLYGWKLDSEPDPDELAIAYMSGLHEGKKRKPWVGLTMQDKKEIERLSVYVESAISLTEAKLKEKNTKGGAA